MPVRDCNIYDPIAYCKTFWQNVHCTACAHCHNKIPVSNVHEILFSKLTNSIIDFTKNITWYDKLYYVSQLANQL